MELINLILTGLLFAAYLCVSVYQNNRIRSLKGQLSEQGGLIKDQKVTLEGLKSLFDTYKGVFEIDRLKEYTDIRVETVANRAVNLMESETKMKTFIGQITSENIKPLSDIYQKQMGDEHWELFIFACNVVIQNREDKTNLEYILNVLPNTKDKLLYIINEEKGLDLEDITPP